MTGVTTGHTLWRQRLNTPLRSFLRTETGSAAVLLAATVAALAWANASPSSYATTWGTALSVSLGRWSVSLDLHGWVNSGLMAVFFFVVGLEARREFDIGELRDRRRLTLPLLAGLGGMTVPVVVFLAFNAGRDSADGWGAAMSTDTAFALGMLALVGSRLPERLRAFLLTVVVVDDIVALAVIATVYTTEVRLPALLAAVGLALVVLAARAAGVRRGAVYALLAVGLWVALLKSGVDPVVAGLAMGLITYAYPAGREELERATARFRAFREQPTPELARTAVTGLRSAVSPNERLQTLFHPWASYVIVPLFALANAGIRVDAAFLAHAFTTPVTLGILVGLVVGKPSGILATAWTVTRLTRGRLTPPVGWAAVAGGGAIAGIGFTVSLLIATLAFSGAELQEAKLGVLSAAVVASALGWIVARATAFLPPERRRRALLGTSETLVDLAEPVDPRRDHVRGPRDAPVTLVEYGDLECPFCGQAEPAVRELLTESGDVRYVWRHLPLTDVHPRAELAAEASEAAARQGAFWPMHDRLLVHQDELSPAQLVHHAAALGLDVTRFSADLEAHSGAARVARDVDSADRSGVSGTPTFFVNGRRYHGAFDLPGLTAAVRAAGARTTGPVDDRPR